MALETEIAAFERQRDELEKHYKGKFVVFHGDEMIGSFDTFDNAAREAIAKFGRGPYLIRQVGAPPPVMPASVMYNPVPQVAYRRGRLCWPSAWGDISARRPSRHRTHTSRRDRL